MRFQSTADVNKISVSGREPAWQRFTMPQYAAKEGK